MSINRVNISGNLTRDPEVRSTASGMAVMGFGMAVNDRAKNPQTGEWEDRPNFIECTMFGTRAEKLSQYLSKGTKVAVEGKLRYSAWEKDGQKRSKVEVVVEELEFMSRGDGQHVAQQPQAYRPPAHEKASPQVQAMVNQAFYNAPVPEVYDEDIPF